jgi:Methyltransferase domain
MLEVARERVPWAEFVRRDAFRMPFADRSFDRVFASFFYGLLPLEDRGRFLEEVRRVGEELILLEPTPEWVSSGRAQGWEERRLSDGSRYQIYRRYFTAETFTEELDGRILFGGRWMVMATVGG